MCFSATASFAAGGALLLVGALTLRKVEQRKELPFAAIPVLFGLQQIVEGFVWLTFDSPVQYLNSGLIHLFALFSHVLWPLLAPFAALSLETVAWRRRAMMVPLALGIIVSLSLLVAMALYPLAAAPIGHHITYWAPSFNELMETLFIWLLSAAYVTATCFGLMLSSHRVVVLFGMLALASYAVTYVFFESALLSVWCFFAGVLSFVVYFHFARRVTDLRPAVA